MAGKCIICNNLERKVFNFDDKLFDGCGCSVGKYDKDKVIGFYSLSSVTKSSKSIKEIEDECDSWDDRFKTKSQTADKAVK
jgi:hypothetical protein